MMLNEVRRKPEKQRIWKSVTSFLCSVDGSIHGVGKTREEAYLSWKSMKEPTPPNRA